MSVFFHSFLNSGTKAVPKNDAKSKPSQDKKVAPMAHPDSPAFPVGVTGILKKTRPLVESDFIPDAPSKKPQTVSFKEPNERKYFDPPEEKDTLDALDVLPAASEALLYDLDETGLTSMDLADDIAQPTHHLTLDDPKKHLSIDTGTDDDILNITIDVDSVPAPTIPKKEFHSWTVQLWKHNNVFSSPKKGEAKPEGFDKFKTALFKTAHLAFLALVDLVRWISGNGYENAFNGDSILFSLENSRFNPNRTYSWLKVEENDSKGMRPEGHWLDQMPAPSRPSLTPALTPATIVDMPAADPIGTFEDNQKNDSKEMRPEGHWLDQMPARSRPSLTPALTPATIVDMSSVPSSMTENLTEAWHLRQSAKVNSRTSSIDLQSANNLIAMFQAPTPASTVTAQALANPAAVQVNAKAWHLRQSAKVDSRTSSIDLQSANNPIATFQAPTPASTVAAQAPASSAVVHVNAVAKPVLAPARLKLSKEKRQAEIAKREKVIKERENQLLNLEIVSDRIETNLGKIRKGMISSDQFDAKSLEEGHQLARMATGKTMMLSNGEKYQFDTADTKKILDAVSNLKRALKASLNETIYEASSTTNKNGKMMPRKKVDAEKQAYDLILSAANDGLYANTLRGSFNESVLREFTQEAEENGFVKAYENAAIKLDRAFRLDIIKYDDENLFLRRVEGVLFITVLNQFAKDYNQTGDLIESTIQGMDTIKAAVAAVKDPDGRPLLNHARVLENFLVRTNHDSNLPKTLIRQQFASEAASIGLPQALKKAFARIDRASKYFITQFESDVAWEKRKFFQETAYPSFRGVLDAALKEAHETALVQKGVSSEWAYAEVAASLNDLVRALDSGELHAKLFGAIDDVDYVQGVREKIQREIFPELVRNAHLQMVAENDATVNHLQLKAAVLFGSGLLAEEAGFVQEVTKLLEKDRTQQNQANLAQNIKAAQNALREAHDLRMEQLLIHVPAKLDELEAAKKAVSDNAEAIEEHANRMIPVDGKQSARLADLIPNAKRIFNFSTDPKRVGLPVVLKEDLSSSPFARIATKYIEEGHHLERKKNRLLEELKAKNKEYIETLAADADDAGFRLVKLNLNSDVENEQEVIESIQSMKDLQAQALEAIHQRYQEMSKPSETSAPLSSLGLAPMPSLTQKKPVLGLPLPRSGISSVPGLLFRLPAAPVQGSFMSNFFSLSRGQKQPLALMPPEPEKEESSLPLTGSGVVSHRKPFSLDDIQVDLDEAADVHLSDADDDADDIIDTPIEKEKIKISLTEEQLAVLTDLEVNP